MPQITVANLCTGPFEIQDLSGLSGASGTPFSLDLGAYGTSLATRTVSVSKDLLERLVAGLNASQTAGKITWSWTDDAADVTDNTRLPLRIATTTPVVMTGLNEVLVCKLASAGAVAVRLPPLPVAGQVVEVIDGTGDAATNNITIVSASGTINGAANMVINTAYGRARFVRSATEWLGALVGKSTPTVANFDVAQHTVTTAEINAGTPIQVAVSFVPTAAIGSIVGGDAVNEVVSVDGATAAVSIAITDGVNPTPFTNGDVVIVTAIK